MAILEYEICSITVYKLDFGRNVRVSEMIVFEVPAEILNYTVKSIDNVVSRHEYLSKLRISIVKSNVYDDYFYAENYVIPHGDNEIFTIRISKVTPLELLESIVDVELHKAYLYFTSRSFRTFRIRASKIFNYELKGETLKCLYAQLVDTVENGVVVKFNSEVVKVFIDNMYREEVHEDPISYIASQVMMAPVYLSGRMVPQKVLDDVEALAILISTYSSEIYEKPEDVNVGFDIAEELACIAKNYIARATFTYSSVDFRQLA